MKATPSTYRIAAAFQAARDPQQDAIIAWLGSLPKDERGGVKRSVMKYHLTRALLMYMQAGADTSTSLIQPGMVAEKPLPVVNKTQAASPVVSAPAPAPPVATTPSSVVAVPSVTSKTVPVLSDPVKKPGGVLRKKIASSMSGNATTN